MATDTEPTTTVPDRHETATAVPWSRQVKAFASRTLRELFHNRSAMFWGLGAPVFYYVLFGVVAGQAVAGRERAALAVSFAIFGIFGVALTTFATNLTADLKRKRYRKLRSLPVAPSADLLGRALGAFVLAIASFLVVLGAGLLTGASFALRSPFSVPVVVISLALFCLVGIAVAVLIASVLNEGEYVLGVTNLLLFGLFFLTGYNGISPSIVPESLTVLINYAPNSLATRLVLYHLTPVGSNGPFSPPALPTDPVYLVVLAGYAVAIAAVASVVMHRYIYAGDGGE